MKKRIEQHQGPIHQRIQRPQSAKGDSNLIVGFMVPVNPQVERCREHPILIRI
jgi:hypothetical protein